MEGGASFGPKWDEWNGVHYLILGWDEWKGVHYLVAGWVSGGRCIIWS